MFGKKKADSYVPPSSISLPLLGSELPPQKSPFASQSMDNVENSTRNISKVIEQPINQQVQNQTNSIEDGTSDGEEVTFSDVLVSHEQRLQQIESSLFRIVENLRRV